MPSKHLISSKSRSHLTKSLSAINKILLRKDPFEIPIENSIYNQEERTTSSSLQTSTFSLPKQKKKKEISNKSISHVKTMSGSSIISNKKKVTFKKKMVQVIEVKSYKKYNKIVMGDPKNLRNNDNVKCACTIF